MTRGFGIQIWTWQVESSCFRRYLNLLLVNRHVRSLWLVSPGADGSLLFKKVRRFVFHPLSRQPQSASPARITFSEQRKHATILELEATLDFVAGCQIRSTELFEVEKQRSFGIPLVSRAFLLS
jgi:hypothetical protein